MSTGAKEFYGRLGWRLDADYDHGKDFRVIQFTPPGSGCSIIFGKNVTRRYRLRAGLYLIVSESGRPQSAARSRRRDHRSVPDSAACTRHGTSLPVWTGPSQGRMPSIAATGVARPRPGRQRLAVQEITTRLPGSHHPRRRLSRRRTIWRARFGARRPPRTARKRTGQRDANWPRLVRAYMVVSRPAESCRNNDRTESKSGKCDKR